MIYISTRDKNEKASPAQAILQGISKEGGLFVPESLPKLSLESLIGKSYEERAAEILSGFLTGFDAEEIKKAVDAAYAPEKFDGGVAPLAKLSPDIYMLELWHGPTCAFKDVALQLLPRLLTASLEKQAGKIDEIAILVATSGDTGKAALEGFKDVDGTKIIVFYPDGGVSEIQRLQMASQDGGNVSVCAVGGNFDDTQTGVKQIFTDKEFAKELGEKNIMLSSANSINWGRLAPQICYYVSAYCDLVSNGELEAGELLDVCVPTGNFGNILAAYYAKNMGLPIGKLICASNINHVLTDFIRTGTYDRRREFFLTASPSMDILISSNLERLLFELYDRDDNAVADLMARLSSGGAYTVNGNVKEKLEAEFYAGYCDEDKTAKTIKETFDKYSYLCDTHTAVALAVANEYREKAGGAKLLVASTASPYKFAGKVLAAITGKETGADEFKQAATLSELTATAVPAQISELRGKAVRFDERCEKSGMASYVRSRLSF